MLRPMEQRQIVLYTDDFKPKLGGIAEYSYQLAKELHRKGHLGGVITPLKQDEKHPFPLVYSYINRDRKINQRRGDKIFLFRKLNSAIHASLIQLYVLRDLYKYVLARGSSIILFTSYYDFSIHRLMVKWCRLLRLPYGIVFHGLDILEHAKAAKKEYEQAINGAAFFVFNSNASRQMFFKHHPELKKNQYVLTPGLDFEAIESHRKYPLSHFNSLTGVSLENKTLISCVAHLRERKGVALGIQVIAALVKEYPHLYYLVGGEGPELPKLEGMVKDLGLQKNVFFLGRLSEAEKFSLLAYSQLFLMPTRSLKGNDFEGFGISFIEASFFKNVVIGGRSGGEKEAIEEGVAGFTFDNDTDEALSMIVEKLEALLKDEAALKKMQSEGRQLVLERFRWEKLVDGFIDFLRTSHFDQ